MFRSLHNLTLSDAWRSEHLPLVGTSPAAFTCSGASLLLSAEPSRRNGMKADARGGSARQTVAVTERKSHRDTNMTEWVRCPHNFSVSHTYPRASRYDDMLTISIAAPTYLAVLGAAAPSFSYRGLAMGHPFYDD